MRIVSLVPSITELLFDLDLEEEVVGITKFCVHPNQWFRSKQRIGGTKNVHIDILQSLSPTLVIASKEENIKDQVDAIASFSEVLLTDVKNLEDAIEMITIIGAKANRFKAAEDIIEKIKANFSNLSLLPYVTLSAAAESKGRNSNPATLCYLIWRNPYMTVGNDTFIHNMLQKCGYNNVFAEQTRYPAITLDDIKKANPDFIFLSSEPYPFKQIHIEELQHELPTSKIILVNGEYFSWYGSRLINAPNYFKSMLSEIE
jgi:ABC-type Fe3+-hydroxamate transport system substrate-binding protein